MSGENELQVIARDLRKASAYFRDGWNLNALQAFIRDGGCCAYCGTPLLDNYGVSKTATIDHLLPSCKYRRGWNVDNLVPACATCNRIKHDYDPSEGKGDGLVITAEIRLALIRKVKEEIDRINKADAAWEREFLTARPRFQEAVAKYLNVRNPSAQVPPTITAATIQTSGADWTIPNIVVSGRNASDEHLPSGHNDGESMDDGLCPRPNKFLGADGQGGQ
jgi:hypothetical protein